MSKLGKSLDILMRQNTRRDSFTEGRLRLDDHGWCHDLNQAPHAKPVDLWLKTFRVTDCQLMPWKIEFGLGLPPFVWCHPDENGQLVPLPDHWPEPTAWRYPPAPPKAT